MKIALLRVGIDLGCGKLLGPVFEDGTFEFICIPGDGAHDERTYGKTPGRHGRKLVEYFPVYRQERVSSQAMHVDPEFETYTYGDPTSPKASLRDLERGDVLAFYAGLQPFERPSDPAMYLIGYFVVERAGRATAFSDQETQELFGANAHVRSRALYAEQRDGLVLVKGGPTSRLFDTAVRISERRPNRVGRLTHVLSEEMVGVFGMLGKTGSMGSIERSPPRWVSPPHVDDAWRFLQAVGWSTNETPPTSTQSPPSPDQR
jgi:Nucleotide modification associated domain 3